MASWGRNDLDQTNAPGAVTDAIAISAGGQQSLALKRDGTVVQWGQTFASVPSGMADVTAIASGTNFHLALLTNTTVVAWGANGSGQATVPDNLSNVVAIAAGDAHALALRSDGTVTGWGSNDFGESDAPSDLTNAMAIAAGATHSAVLRNDGTVVAWGDNTAGQTNLPADWGPVKLIAAGQASTLANLYSPLVQYQVDVTKDLLLIYNTNSLGSSNVCSYYLQHRPMVGGANVLPVGCPTNEIMDIAAFTDQTIAPVQGWVAINPTKHPRYIILFPDMPTRVWGTVGDETVGYSVAFGLRTNISGIQPFVTSINMGLWDATNDCMGYIDKVQQIGTSFCPGKLIISPGAEYGNTNFVLDDIRHGTGYDGANGDLDYSDFGDRVWAATNALLTAGIPQSAILFYDGIETIVNGVRHDLTHPSGLTNLGGYMCWGAHSSLGNTYARPPQRTGGLEG